MQKKVYSLTEFLNEAKLKRKSASASAISYQDIFRLPEYQELKEMGFLLPEFEDASFKGTGMIRLTMGYHTVVVTDQTLLNRMVSDEEETDESKKRGYICEAVIDKDGSIYLKGMLIGGTHRIRSKKLETLADYAYNMRIIASEMRALSAQNGGWHLTKINGQDDIDSNRTDSLLGGAINDLW